jgi:oligopeptide/dipeptide ABC transporter ATP-binding protein
MTEPLLKVRDLSIRFDTPRGLVHAVNNVGFDLMPSRTLAIVGESGSGKSVLSRAILRLLPEATSRRSGQILFDGKDLAALGEPDLRKVRGKDIAMIFQDPMSSLNPVLTIERQIGEVLELHLGLAAAERRQRTIALLRSVGIASAEQRLREYPHQLSGGLRQRVMIAMALAGRPKVLIADEPTTALDVTVQAQILDLIRSLQRDFGMAVILITHDLAAVGGIADEVAVMYGGRFVEQAPTDAFFKKRLMPYSEALLKARPDPFAPRGARLEAISGRPPDLTALPPGCAFAARCAKRQPDCLQAIPPLTTLSDRRYACFHPLAGAA